MKTWWRAVREEARAVFTDAGAALVLVAAVFVYAVVYPTPYVAGVLQRLPVAVIDLDHTAMSRQLTRMIDAHQFIELAPPVPDQAAAERAVREGRLAGYVVIPVDFERTILRGERTRVAALVDATYVLAYRQALAGLLEAAGTLSAGIELRRATAAGAAPAVAASLREPFHVVTRPLFNATESYATYIVPAVLVLILQQTQLVGVGLIAGTRRERERERTMAAAGLLTRPGPAAALLRVAGRTAFYVLLYGVYALLYFGVIFPFEGFAVRSPAADLAWFTLPYLLAATMLAQALGAFFTDRETAMFAIVWTSLPAVFLAGFAWPREAMPAWTVVLGQFLPSTAAIDGVLRLTQLGARLGDVSRQITVLSALAGAYGALAVLLEWWRAGRGRDQVRPAASA